VGNSKKKRETAEKRPNGERGSARRCGLTEKRNGSCPKLQKPENGGCGNQIQAIDCGPDPKRTQRKRFKSEEKDGEEPAKSLGCGKKESRTLKLQGEIATRRVHGCGRLQREGGQERISSK